MYVYFIRVEKHWGARGDSIDAIVVHDRWLSLSPSHLSRSLNRDRKAHNTPNTGIYLIKIFREAEINEKGRDAVPNSRDTASNANEKDETNFITRYTVADVSNWFCIVSMHTTHTLSQHDISL